MNGITLAILGLLIVVWLSSKSDMRPKNNVKIRRKTYYNKEPNLYSEGLILLVRASRKAMLVLPIILALLYLPVQLLTLPYNSEYTEYRGQYGF